ncbi:hypothetical protein BO82DRAFT_406025 [Aspergillus uvarum CBS 121591]|uniref:Uncharacterized protein n=1 Tax=Aspergillus uvarum CBS 121591 TaxID=1448315 RepID=A0A319CG84_9EURO|nr:hypothetical protein BO82DRAFT_406025 [Aspergillus uvarum CBS 121591]PYH77593.1 hypothetical protein BO82DRAFT_406025 [Aspergillus uvarum CBS 121591]
MAGGDRDRVARCFSVHRAEVRDCVVFVVPKSYGRGIGTNPPYVTSITCFTLFAIGAPLNNTIAGILILRWLQGVMAALETLMWMISSN